MTPLDLTILLHYYSKTDDYWHGDFIAPDVAISINGFVKIGMIKPTDQPSHKLWEITGMGSSHVDAALALYY